MMMNIISKVKRAGVVFLVLVFAIVLLPTTNTYAAHESGGVGGNNSGGDCTTNDSNFLGFPTWYRGLPCEETNGVTSIKIAAGDNIGNIALKIGLNVVDIMLRVLALVALGFIIYSGYRYMTTSDDTDRIARAKRSLSYAIVGLIVGLMAASAVGFIVTNIK